MPRVSNALYSYCGIVCSFCRRFAQGECHGCDVHADACEYIKCCLRRGLRCCLECGEFPCKLHSEGFVWVTEELGALNWRVYGNEFLDMFRRARAPGQRA